MKIAITGSTGLIGSALAASLSNDGHTVVRLVRHPSRTPTEVSWDPLAGTLDRARLEGIDAVVHLAGAGVGDRRWTTAYRATIRDSRVRGTQTLARALCTLDAPPQVLVAGSAMGYYGSVGDAEVTEDSPPGSGFLADVVRDWEAAADPVREAGIRLVHSRSGLVVAGPGGAWGRMWPLFRIGLGGRLGSGQQWWSWVSLRDEVRALRLFLDEASTSGPYNVTAPNPATNAMVTAAMGRLLHRPTFAHVPTWVLRTTLGEMSQEVLGSARVLPRRLLASGFVFDDLTIDQALTWAWYDDQR